MGRSESIVTHDNDIGFHQLYTFIIVSRAEYTLTQHYISKSGMMHIATIPSVIIKMMSIIDSVIFIAVSQLVIDDSVVMRGRESERNY